MKQRLKDILKGPVVFHPLLFAAFPILFLYAYNISETSAGQMRLPLLISVAAALVLWAVLSLILRSLAKAGLATAVFLLFFFSYGHLYEALESAGALVPKHAYLLPVMLFVWGYCVYFIGRAGRDFRLTTRLLNIAAVALIAINLFNIASYEIRLRGAGAEPQGETTQQPVAEEADLDALPDIYFIIPDEYSHPDTMLEWYDSDIGWFIDSLKDKGFFTAHKSETPTGNTERAIAGVLNMEYPDAEASSDQIYRMISYNKAAEFLRAQGYRFIYFGNGHDIGRWDSYMEDSADLYFNYRIEAASPWVSEFQETLWNTTMLRPFYYHLVGSQYEVAQRRVTLYTLEHLKALPREEGPKFVVAHFYCPHQPFVFGPNGEYIEPVNWANYEDKQFYLGQYIFISREIEKMVDVLLRESEIPPIIILQSDHGLRPHHRGIQIGPNEWRKILNAMYLPGMDYAELSDSIAPVNTFRLIFNHYFGADYELLPDD